MQYPYHAWYVITHDQVRLHLDDESVDDGRASKITEKAANAMQTRHKQ